MVNLMSEYIDLPLSGLEGPLSEMEETVQDMAHRFAAEVLRPAGQEIDALTAEEALAPDSPLWSVLAQAGELGLTVSAMAELSPSEGARLMLIASEELAWGDAGLAGMMLVSQMPAVFSVVAGREDLASSPPGPQPGRFPCSSDHRQTPVPYLLAHDL